MKKVAVLGRVLDVDKETHQDVAINLPELLPLALDSLAFGRNSPELARKFNHSLRDHGFGHWASVVKPERQQDFESSAGNAHRWPGLAL